MSEALEKDIEMVTISRNSFPGVLVVQHELGVSHTKSLQMISRHVPEDTWHLVYIHSSPACVDGSSMNLLNKNMQEFVRLTRWTIKLMRMMNPGRWTLENASRIKKYLTGVELCWAENVKMEEITGMSSCRKKTIASDRECTLKTLTKEGCTLHHANCIWRNTMVEWTQESH